MLKGNMIPTITMSAIATTASLIASSLVAANIYKRYETADPNEWLLLIKDGELKQSGVGISVFRGFNEVVVRFPSLLNKVQFKAQQVSKEMQGVEVAGFLIWVVHRDGNNPMKAYRHIRDLSNLTPESEVNQHLKAMAESIVRHQIANLSINDVISQRKKVRDGIVGEMQEVLSGWGIWLETVEITEVKVLSNSLFNDLQQPYRSETREMAEQIRISSQFKLDQARNEKDMESKIQRQKQQQILDKQKEDIKRQEIEMRNQTQLLKCKMDLDLQKQNQRIAEDQKQHALKMKELDLNWELKKAADWHAVDEKMGEVSMRKEVLKTVETVYKSMRWDSMRFVNVGPDATLEHGIGKMAVALNQIMSDKKE